MEKDKLKVLLLVPDYYLVIGTLGKYIANACTGIDYYFFYEGGIHGKRDEFHQLLSHVDVLHVLSNMSSADIPSSLDISTIPCPKVTTIHHMEPGEEQKITKAEAGDVIHVTAKEWEIRVREMTYKPVCLAHQPIDLPAFRKNRAVRHPRTPFRIGWFGLSGALDNRKRLDVLLEALAQLRSENIPFELVIRGPVWKELTSFFLEKGISIRNLGYVSSEKISRGYSEVDLYVCTSDIEGGPLTCMEALASGVPVVSTPVGQVPEVVALGGGILVEKNNPAAVSEAIKKIILDPAVYDHLCADVRKVSLEYSGEKITQEYISLYQRAIREYEKNTCNEWISPLPLPVDPKTQRDKELAYASFREARHQKRKGYLFQSFRTEIKAMGNRQVPLKVKMRELMYFLRYTKH